MVLPVTFTFVSCYAIVLVCLTAWIGLYRGRTNALRGEGQDPVLFKRSRFYGNLIENGPAMALVLGASEAMGLSAIWLWIAASSFVAGRILYFVLFDQKVRAVPMIMTQFPAAAIGVWIILTIWS